MSENHRQVVVVEAGRAGRAPVCNLTQHEVPVTVLEAGLVVGGISRTLQPGGWRFLGASHEGRTVDVEAQLSEEGKAPRRTSRPALDRPEPLASTGSRDSSAA